MFFRKNPPKNQPASDLKGAIESSLPNVEEDTRQIVVAVAGLLGCVSYADQHFSENEKTRVRSLLSTIVGIGSAEADAILASLEKNIILVSTTEVPRFARTLKQLGDRDLRLHVLDMLLDVASVDHAISHDEVVVLRQITRALGLEQADYNELQSQHKDKLSSLKQP